jgi:hypothetical protein
MIIKAILFDINTDEANEEIYRGISDPEIPVSYETCSME